MLSENRSELILRFRKKKINLTIKILFCLPVALHTIRRGPSIVEVLTFQRRAEP